MKTLCILIRVKRTFFFFLKKTNKLVDEKHQYQFISPYAATKVFCYDLLLFIRSRISEFPCLGKAVMWTIPNLLSVSTCISIAFVPYMIIRILLYRQSRNLCLAANKPKRDFSTFYFKINQMTFNFMSRIFISFSVSQYLKFNASLSMFIKFRNLKTCFYDF